MALGSNLCGRKSNIRAAIKRLREHKSICVVKVSGFYETAPCGGPRQGDYINAAAEIKTRLGPMTLLKVFKRIEALMGRPPGGPRWGPRTIDIDILAYGNEIIDTEELKVPHPLMCDRYFVLAPLAGIAPGFIHPASGEKIRTMLLRVKRRKT